MEFMGLPRHNFTHYAVIIYSITVRQNNSCFSRDARKKLKLKILSFYLHQVKAIFKHISVGLSSRLESTRVRVRLEFGLSHIPETLAPCSFITPLRYFNFLTQFIKW